MNRMLTLFLVCAGAVALLSRAVDQMDFSVILAAIGFFLIMGVSFVRGTPALYLIAFAMLFSPEVGTSMKTGRSAGEGAGVVVRFEDVLIMAVAIGWLLRTTFHGRQFGIVRNSLNKYIGAYILLSVVSTLMGVIFGGVRMETGLFHNLKYFEYFLLYFMILAHVREKQIISRMIGVMIFVFFLTVLFGYYQMGTGVERVCAPFDEEPNTYGGYMVLIMSICLGIVLTDPRARIVTIMVLVLLAALPPFGATLSRASYMGLAGGLLAFLVFSHKRILIGALLVIFMTLAFSGLPVLPENVRQRISGTFVKQSEYQRKIAGVDLDSSASARIVSFEEAFSQWQSSPVFGVGVTGTHFIDGQFVRLLVETGIAGVTAFCLMLVVLMKEIWKVYRHCADPFIKGATLGFFCGTFGLFVHALSANTFIILRIAEPFWVLAALLLLMPRLAPKEAQAA